MGIEPHPRTATARGNGFEDRERQQATLRCFRPESSTRVAADSALQTHPTEPPGAGFDRAGALPVAPVAEAHGNRTPPQVAHRLGATVLKTARAARPVSFRGEGPGGRRGPGGRSGARADEAGRES